MASEAKTIDEKVVIQQPDSSSALASTAYDPDRPPLPPGASTIDPLIGRRIDHFEIRALLGQGGMGTVYLAHDLSLERAVAIKVLRRELADNPELVSRLVLEARAQARLQHPNVVNVYYIGTYEGAPYFAMEYVRGQTLADVLQKSGALRWEDALEYVLQTARALMEAHHRGIVHRDVKPSNLMVTDTSQHPIGATVKVADFGLAAPPGFREEHFVGSPFYASPEQLAGKPPDHRSDIYSLGVTFHELLTGAPPFQADSLREISKLHHQAPRPPISPRVAPWRLRQLIVEMMDPEPTKRPWTYEDLLRRLETLKPKVVVPGGLMARTMAFALDLGLFAFLGSVLASAFKTSQALAHEIAFLLFGFYYVAMHRISGRTLGKRMFGLRIQGTTKQISAAGLTLRFFVQFWGPITAVAMIHLSLATPSATDIATVREHLSELVGVEKIPVFDGRTEDLLRILWVPNLLLAVPWLACFLFPLFDDNRMALHDKVAQTRVIYAIREDTNEGEGL